MQAGTIDLRTDTLLTIYIINEGHLFRELSIMVSGIHKVRKSANTATQKCVYLLVQSVLYTEIKLSCVHRGTTYH